MYESFIPLAGAYSFFSLLRQIEKNSLARGDNFHGNSIPQYGNVKLMEVRKVFSISLSLRKHIILNVNNDNCILLRFV